MSATFNEEEHSTELARLNPQQQQQSSNSTMKEPSYRDDDDNDEGSDAGSDSETSSTSSSSSAAERARNNATAAASALNNNNQQQQDEQDSWSDDDEDTKGLLSSMEKTTERRLRPEDLYDDVGDDLRTHPSQVAKKRQNRRRVAAGVAGSVAGLVMIGPCTAVAAGVAGAMLIKRFDRRKEKEAKTLTKGENELASLISPRAEV